MKYSVISHLNHSNQIRNEKFMAKIRTLVKIEQSVPHLFHTCTSTGSVLERYTGTGSRCTSIGN